MKLILKEIKVISGKVKDEVSKSCEELPHVRFSCKYSLKTLSFINLAPFKTDTDLIDGEWKFAAMVLDRVCLITLCILTVVLSLAIFSSAPNVFVP